MKGSITLESSVIYPIIIVITFTLILLSFRMHDRLSLKATAYTTLIKQYHNPDAEYELTHLEEILDTVCLLSDSVTAYKYNLSEVLMKHDSGTIRILFSHWERCEFIRATHSLMSSSN